MGLQPKSVLEPSCGTGNFLLAAFEAFPDVVKATGLDINGEHVQAARVLMSLHGLHKRTNILHADIFSTDWTHFPDLGPDPLLIIGNPPWVTNAALGALHSGNLPPKYNAAGLAGLDAVTGAANFDIAEWIILKALDLLAGREGALAMLCKTSTAKRVILDLKRAGRPVSSAAIHAIDAKRHFGVNVSACLLTVTTCGLRPWDGRFPMYDGLDVKSASVVNAGVTERGLVLNMDAYERLRHLDHENGPKWRSGVKHDCAHVMELHREGDRLRNGLGEIVDIEGDCLYPLCKSAMLSTDVKGPWPLFMPVTQKSLADDPVKLRVSRPKAWAYLEAHADLLDARRSSIYHNRPRFAIFGVGDYTFSLWKVAVSGFAAQPQFTVIPPREGKPTILDDTCYFLPFQTEEEARTTANRLNSPTAQEFFSCLVSPEAKRPITARILGRLDVAALAAVQEREK